MVNEEDEIDEAVVLEEGESEDDDDYDSYDYLDTGMVVKGVAIVVVVGTIIAAPHIKKLYKERIKPSCRRAWSKITKRLYEPLDTPAVSEEQPVELPDQSECIEQKDGE